MKASHIYEDIKAMKSISYVKNISLCLLTTIASTIAGFSQEGPTSSATVGKETEPKPTSHRPSQLYGEWFCNGDKNDIYRILSEKTAQHFRDSGVWRVTNGLLTISWNNGYRLTIDTSQTGPSVIGNSFPPGRDEPDLLRLTKAVHEPTDPPHATSATAATLPVQRILTAADGRKMDVIIIENGITAIKAKRCSDGKIFSLDLEKLSAADQEFVKGLQPAPPSITTTDAHNSAVQTQIEIAVCGSQVKVTRLGNVPLGVIFFGHTGWNRIIPTIVDGASEFDELLPDKTSFFLWEYPDKRNESPFNKTDHALTEYDKGDTEKFRPDFKGIATGVLAQIRQQAGIKNFLLVGNSLGAGVILWDYPELVKDPLVKFLLISPTEPFMPLIPDLVKLERTMLLTGVEDPTGTKEFPDEYMKGKEACRWAKANTDSAAIRKINESLNHTENGKLPLNMRYINDGHIIIGNRIKNPILARLIKVNLGMASSNLLTKPLDP